MTPCERSFAPKASMQNFPSPHALGHVRRSYYKCPHSHPQPPHQPGGVCVPVPQLLGGPLIGHSDATPHA